MQNFTTTAVHLYRQLFGTPELAGQLADGIETVLDGNTAIAITEACITEVAALGAGFSEQGAAFAWLSEQQRVSYNLFAEKLSIQQADSPRGALASAMGVTLSGHRSTVFLSAQDLSGCQDLLDSAVGRHLPLVIHLDNQQASAQGVSSASGHDAVSSAMESGCIVLFAENIQQAVDFTLIARQVAEIAMTPAVVVMDAVETALAIQDVRLPSAELVKTFIGRSDDLIPTPSIAQKQLFSDHRRRIHCWHDLDKPLLNGALYEPQTYALGKAAKDIFFDDIIAQTLNSAYSEFYKLTGRHYSSISTYSLIKADVIVLAQGSAVETLKSLSDLLKTKKKTGDLANAKIKLGVIGIHAVNPFNSEQLLDVLYKNKAVSGQLIVLERSSKPLSSLTLLIRMIRGYIHKALESKEYISSNFSHLESVFYGLGGSSLNMADCLEMLLSVKNNTLTGRYLGIPFTSEAFNLSRTKECHPKRQVMIDTLQRYYPQINNLGIYSLKRRLSIAAENNSMSFAVSHTAGQQQQPDYALELSHFLFKTLGGFVRSSAASFWEQWGKRQLDNIIHSENVLDTGSSILVDYYIHLSNDGQSIDGQSLLNACNSLNSNGVVIFNGLPAAVTSFTENELKNCLGIINDKNLTLYHANSNEPENISTFDGEVVQWEITLATLIGILLNNKAINIKTRKLSSTRAAIHEHLADFDQQQQDDLLSIFKDALNESIETIEPFDISLFKSFDAVVKNGEKNEIVPESVKKLGQASRTIDSLPLFWDQVGALKNNGHFEQLSADPYLATGTIPPLSATFNDMEQHRLAAMPSFDPQHCTACGACWSNCPDSAIATVSMSPKDLLETGIRLAKADSVRPIVAKLAARISKNCRNGEMQFSRSEEVLNEAFAWFSNSEAMEGERLKTITTDFEKLTHAIADLPLVASDLLFHSAEQKQNGSGELFSLIINPDSCKACGLCVELCMRANPEEKTAALSFYDNSDQLTTNPETAYQQQWQIWQQTPDTPSATIERLISEQTMDSGTALMLSRYNAFALSGGDHAELASGEKIVIRQILSATEYHQQPLLHRFISELDELREKIKAEINVSMSIALPTDNLTELSQLLSDVKTRQVDLNELLDKTTNSPLESTAIDAVKISQLVNLVLQINELHWNLSRGSHGLGRSRYSLCITSSSIARWAGTFPYNPFHVPVTIDTSGETAQLAAGLVHGQINDLLSAISVMRQARASIDARYAKQTECLEQLDWDDLSVEEKQLCPPLLLIGGDDLLGSHGFSQISSMLNSSYPIKIVILNELDGGLCNTSANSFLHKRNDSNNNLAMMALSQRNAYVAQSSIANNSHLQSSVHELMNYSGSGLLSVHSPSPSRHGFSPLYSLLQAELAVNSRMFPLFRYNPQHEGVFGSRLSLAGNDEIKNEWLTDENNKSHTPANWAVNERRFKDYFSPLGNNTALACELQDWLNSDTKEQANKTPYFEHNMIQKDGQLKTQKITITKEFAYLIMEKQNTWRTLQELAGIVTPFTDYVEQCAAERLSTEHQADLDALKKEYDAKVRQIEENYNQQTHTKIRNQLLGLAGYDAKLI
ncbi:MAG: hypothetical protein KZQ83_16595 [gamma proteobacterium symbiont of Taylorina sp.]|nr:hypothetical protein [gamma proteobacterium symbiont of Taylorina sp.]